MNCILNVTDHEYDRILQLNHDQVAWSNEDRHLLDGLSELLGPEVAAQVAAYDDCRMEKHFDVVGIPRVEPDWSALEQAVAPLM